MKVYLVKYVGTAKDLPKYLAKLLEMEAYLKGRVYQNGHIRIIAE